MFTVGELNEIRAKAQVGSRKAFRDGDQMERKANDKIEDGAVHLLQSFEAKERKRKAIEDGRRPDFSRPVTKAKPIVAPVEPVPPPITPEKPPPPPKTIIEASAVKLKDIGLPDMAEAALKKAGYNNLAEVSALEMDALLDIDGVGPILSQKIIITSENKLKEIAGK